MPGPGIGWVMAIPPSTHSCIFHMLFKPTERLASFVADARMQLFGAADTPYVAIHLRLGGFEGEGKAINRFGGRSQATVIAESLEVAKELAEAHGIPGPILVITDNEFLRSMLHGGLVPGFVTPNYTASHILTKGNSAKHKVGSGLLPRPVADRVLTRNASWQGSSIACFSCALPLTRATYEPLKTKYHDNLRRFPLPYLAEAS